jgi:glycerol-3-phosphate dehydrogenase (NAD(P)+)
MNFCILPAGAWGTAMAIHLNRNGNTVTLAPHTMEEALDIATSRENKAFFPGFELNKSIQIGMELMPAMMEADVCILACPSKFLRSVCKNVKSVIDSGTAKNLKLIISLCKGLEEGTHKLPAQVMQEELGDMPIAVLSGPTFASQVAKGQPSAIVLAGNASAEVMAQAQAAISGDNVRVYTSSDMTGVELGGCLKNVYAIASGCCDGLGLGDNTKAALLTRSLHEMTRLGIALGGLQETFYGLTGMGDLVLTCNGKESRNRTFGELIAKGETIEELIEVRKMTVEGYRTSKCFYEICQEKQLDAPILSEIYNTLYNGQSPAHAIQSLMSRSLKAEATI